MFKMNQNQYIPTDLLGFFLSGLKKTISEANTFVLFPKNLQQL